MPGSVVSIYVAAKAGGPLHAEPAAQLESGKGVVGDRYFKRQGTFSEKLKDRADWEVTLIESEEIDRFNLAIGEALLPGAFRRNLVTSGVRLNDLVGRRFCVGSALLEGMRLCEPCAHLAKLLHPSAVAHLTHRAGLRARIVHGATVRAGDAIREVDAG